jgi:hypothetical protein
MKKKIERKVFLILFFIFFKHYSTAMEITDDDVNAFTNGKDHTVHELKIIVREVETTLVTLSGTPASSADNVSHLLEQINSIRAILSSTSSTPAITTILSINGLLGGDSGGTYERVLFLYDYLNFISGGTLRERIENLVASSRQNEATLNAHISVLNSSLSTVFSNYNTLRKRLTTALSRSPETDNDAILTLMTNIKDSEANLQSIILALNILLGGSGTIYERAQTLITSLSTVSSNYNTLRERLTTALSTSPDTDNDAILTLMTNIRDSEANLQSIISALNTLLGGSGTTSSDKLADINALLGGTDATTYDKASALNTLLGGTGTTHERIVVLMNSLSVSSIDYLALRGRIVATLGANTAADLATLFGHLDGSDGTTGVIDTIVSTLIGNIKASEASISSAITALNTLLGGAGTTYERAQTLSTALTTSTNNYDTLRGRIVATLGANTAADLATLFGHLDGSDGTTGVIDTIVSTLIGNIKASEASISSAITALNTLLGGAGTTYERAQTLSTALTTSTNNYATLRGRIVATLGANTAADLATLFGHLDGSDGTTGVIDTIVSTLIGNIKASEASIQSAITALNTLLGGAGTTYERAQTLSTALTTSTNNYDTLRGRIVATLGANAAADLATLFGHLDGSDGTTGVIDTIVSTLIGNIKASEASISSAITALNTLLGGAGTTYERAQTLSTALTTSTNNYDTLRGRIVATLGANTAADLATLFGHLDGSDGTTGVIDTIVSTLIGNIKASEASIQSAITALNTLLGGAGTTYERAQTLSTALTTSTNNYDTLRGRIVATLGANTAADLATLFGHLDGSDGTTGVIDTIVSTLIGNIKASEASIQSAITALNTLLGGAGTTYERAQTLSTALTTSTNNYATLRGRIVATLGANAAADLATLFGHLDGSDGTTGVIDTIVSTLIGNIKASEASISSAITALNTLLGGAGTTYERAQTLSTALTTSTNNYDTLRGRIVATLGANTAADLATLFGHLDGSDGTTGVIDTIVSTLIGNIKASEASIQSAITALNTLLGGAGTTYERAQTLSTALTTSTNNYATLRGRIVATLGANTAADLATLFGHLDGSDGTTGVIDTIVSTLIGNIKASEASISSAITALNTLLGGAGTTYERAQTLSTALTTSTNNYATLRGRIVATLGANAAADLATLFGHLDGSDGTTGVIDTIVSTLIGNIKASEASIQSAITALNTLLGGAGTTYERAQTLSTALTTSTNNYDTLRGRIVATLGANAAADLATLFGHLDGSDGTTGVIDTIVSTLIGNIKASEASIQSAITALNTLLGGAGTTYERAQTLSTALTTSTNNYDTLRGRIVATLGANTAADLATLFGHLDGSDGTTGVIDTIVSTLIGNIKASEASISSAITALNTLLGGAGTTYERAQTLSTALTTSTNNYDTLRGRIVATLGANTAADLATLFGHLDGSDGTTGVIDTIVSTLIGNIKASEASISSAITALNTLLGGAGTTYARINALSALLLSAPTGVITDDIETLRAWLVATPGATLQDDIETLRASLLTTPGATLQDDIETLRAWLVTTPGATLQDDIHTIAMLLVGNTNFAQSIFTMMNSLKTNMVNTVSSLPTETSSLTVQAPASADISGHVNITLSGNIYNISGDISIADGAIFSLTNGSNTLTLYNRSGSTINNLEKLINYLNFFYPVGFKISTNFSDIISTLMMQVGGTAYSLNLRLSTLNSTLVTAPTGVIATDLQRARNLLTDTPEATLEADIQSLNALLDGNTLGSTLKARINALSALLLSTPGLVMDDLATLRAWLVTTPGATLQDDIHTIAMLLVGNTNFAQSIFTMMDSLKTSMENNVSSLPTETSSLTVQAPASADSSGGVNITLSGNIYNISAPIHITDGAPFSLTNGSNTLTLYNRSGSTINNLEKLINYLNSLHPVGSKISTNLSDIISTSKAQVGGTASSLTSRLSTIDRRILTTPTGVITTDLQTARNLLTDTPEATLEADIQSLNALLDGNASGSTLQARIGTPITNGASSSLVEMIRGDKATSVADALGDPMLGGSGLSALIKGADGSAVSNPNNLPDLDPTGFDGATNFKDQLTQFLNIFNSGSYVIPQGNYSSLKELLNALNKETVN